MHKSGIILCATLGALIAVAPTRMHAQEVISIETGQVQGSSEGGITSFKGVPYGGPLTLVQTTFNDCTFQFGHDLNSRRALTIIQAANGKPVNIYLS
jgi:hypothetical protein